MRYLQPTMTNNTSLHKNTMNRPTWDQGIWENLTLNEYQTIENSYEVVLGLAVASGKYDISCPEQEHLAELFASFPEHVKEYGLNIATAMDSVNTYMQCGETDKLVEGISVLIEVITSPVSTYDIPKNHGLTPGLYELFSENGELPEFLVLVARQTHKYFTRFSHENEGTDILNAINMYTEAYAVVLCN